MKTIKPLMNLESAFEAFTERTAIMEINGGLDRRAATIRAFELCFPGDYRECMRIAANHPDGETTLYEYLEGLIKPSRTHEKGPSMSSETKNVKSYGKPSESSLQAQETHPRAIREGLAALQYMTNHHIPLIGVYSSGAMIAKQEPGNFTTDFREIADLIAGKGDREGRATGSSIERFYFIPANSGILCLDIDRKNGKDGIAELYAWAERTGKPGHLLPRFLQDLPANFPCYVQTPSGGLHLYFSYLGGKVQKKTLSPETPGVEIKHGAPGLTAPGSYKNGTPYILYGDLETAPPLPAFILAAIELPKPQAAVYIPQPQRKKAWGKPAWDKIREWTETDGTGAGRNDRAFHLACHARNHGYTEAETIDALRRESCLDGLPEKEIETAVKSAFTRRRTA